MPLDCYSKNTNRVLMMNLSKFIYLSFFFIVFCLTPFMNTDACTIIFIANDKLALVGANEDSGNPNSKMWFIPATENTYGRICFGFDKEYRIAESGMNDQGLFIDVNSLSRDTGWKPSPEKPDLEEWQGWFGTGVPDGILAKCATVREAVAIFENYNLLTFATVKYLIADKTGDSAVLEWSRSDLHIVRRTGGYQISTNFVTSDYKPEEYPCERFKIAHRILGRKGNAVSLELILSVMSSTCFEYFTFTPTVYSVCCDLRNGQLYVYLFHNFEQAITLNIHDELQKGAARYRLHDLFSIHSFSYRQFLEKAGGLSDPQP
jgi:hypothetical protein